MQTIYNVGVYARLSREDERESESASIENQKEMLCRHVKEQGWNLYSVYVDDGVSGTSFDRPGLNSMITDAKDKKINLILCKDLSRFGRDYIEVGRYTDIIFPSIGCRFVALNDGVDTIHKNSDMMMVFKNVMNDFYARDTSNKIKAVLHSAHKAGKFVGCRTHFGYIRDPNNKHKLIIDPEAAAIVKRIFDLRYQGYGHMRIAHTLNDEKVITPRVYQYRRDGKPNPFNENGFWNDISIRQILANEFYIGHLVQNKTGNTSYKNKKTIHKPPEEWVKVENTHEPIVSLEVWERVRQMAEAAARPKRTKYGEISPYAGFMYCRDCGFAMRYQRKHQTFKNGNVATYESYMCGSSSRSGKQACSSHYIPLHLLNEIVIADITQKASMVEYDEQSLFERVGTLKAAEGQSQLAAMNTAKRAAEKRCAELERLIQSLYEDKVKKVISEDVCARLINQYEAERREQSEKVQILTEQIDNFQLEQSNTREWSEVIRQYKNLESINRDILTKLINKIEVGEKEIIDGQKQREIRIYYKFVGYIG
ncbi:MAG: recombinase family protein [Oscillospiraceae bacterium]|nr:recombinase family protein [Oscillospiraceae bacterium]